MICGNTIEMIEAQQPNVVCCGQEMNLMQEKTEDQGQEKHVPIVEEGEKVKVTVGEIEHPMEENHFIELVELIKDDKVIAGKWLSPGMKPVAEFCTEETNVNARIYCNVHGAWKN